MSLQAQQRNFVIAIRDEVAAVHESTSSIGKAYQSADVLRILNTAELLDLATHKKVEHICCENGNHNQIISCQFNARDIHKGRPTRHVNGEHLTTYLDRVNGSRTEDHILACRHDPTLSSATIKRNEVRNLLCSTKQSTEYPPQQQSVSIAIFCESPSRVVAFNANKFDWTYQVTSAPPRMCWSQNPSNALCIRSM